MWKLLSHTEQKEKEIVNIQGNSVTLMHGTHFNWIGCLSEILKINWNDDNEQCPYSVSLWKRVFNN